MHGEYARFASEYPADKAAHAWSVLRILYASGNGGNVADGEELFATALRDLVSLSARVEAQVFATRAKDYTNRFRMATFRDEAEMRAVVGCPEDNPFVRKTRKDMASLRERAAAMSSRLSCASGNPS